MHKYSVTVTYTAYTGIQPSERTLSFWKEANSASMAISISSSLLGSLLNCRGNDTNSNLYVITSVTATLIPGD